MSVKPYIKFKRGDLVTCSFIETIHGDCIGVTVGKTYKVLDLDRYTNIWIVNDNGIYSLYTPERFKLVTREQKLKRILNGS